MKISKMAGLATLAWPMICATAWAAEPAGGQKQPPGDLVSQIVRASDVKPKRSAWGETRRHFRGQTFATENIFVATVLIHPGKFNHRSHRHAEEEYMVMVEGTGARLEAYPRLFVPRAFVSSHIRVTPSILVL